MSLHSLDPRAPTVWEVEIQPGTLGWTYRVLGAKDACGPYPSAEIALSCARYEAGFGRVALLPCDRSRKNFTCDCAEGKEDVCTDECIYCAWSRDAHKVTP